MMRKISRHYQFLKLISNRIRWQLILALAKSDLNVQELVALVKAPQNVVSYHLRLLREGDLIAEHQSISDGREIFYSVNYGEIASLFNLSAAAIHPTLISPLKRPSDLSGCRILVVCTHNSARSQIAEGIFKAKMQNKIQVYSAGTHPLDVHPLAIRALDEMQIDITHQRAKHLNDFLNTEFDYVITVCDRARDSCPVFRGSPETIHWSLPDPLDMEGNHEEQLTAFRSLAKDLSKRIDYFLARILVTQSE